VRRSTTRVAATLDVGLGRLHKSDGCVRGRGSRPVTAFIGRTHPLLGMLREGGTKVPPGSLQWPAEPFGKCKPE
jgi:hypothetical protein